MLMRRLLYILVMTALGSCPSLYPRTFFTYLVKITNNSSRSFTIYCDNYRRLPVLFVSPTELNSFQYSLNRQGSTSEIEQTIYQGLLRKKDALSMTLTTEGKSARQIAEDDHIQDLDRQIADQVAKMRPIIKPKQTIDGLPCRVFGPADTPIDKPADWKMPEAFLETEGIRIQISDTNERRNCGIGFTLIEARSKNHLAAACVDTTDILGQVHLIINPDETFRLEMVKQVMQIQ